MRTLIYSKTVCPFCQLAKQYFAEHAIEYSEVNYDDDAKRQAMYDELGLVGQQRTVPQIFVIVNGISKRIGGYQDLLGSDLVDQSAVDFDEDF